MRMRFPMLLLGLIVATAAAGCTTTAGDPSPESSSPTSKPTGSGDDDLPTDGAPAVDGPLDLTEFVDEPCKVMTSQQIQDFGLGPGEPLEGDFGPVCTWTQPQLAGGAMSFSLFTSEDNGLSGVYQENENGDFTYFKELSKIEDYPAVAYDLSGEDPPVTGCSVAVGVSDQLSFSAKVSLSKESTGEQDPCETAIAVAAMMVNNIKGEQ